MLPSEFLQLLSKNCWGNFPSATIYHLDDFTSQHYSDRFLQKVQRRSPGRMVFRFYLMLIIVYPYASSGLRFIYPVLPFLIIYLAKGIQTIYHFITSKDNSFTLLTIIFSLSILLSLRMFFSLPTADGPYSIDAHSAFNYIQTNTPDNSVVLFSGDPEHWIYMPKRKSTFLVQHKSELENLTILKNLKCDYVLYAIERSELSIKACRTFWRLTNRNMTPSIKSIVFCFWK